jgi:hypothetical protein
MSIFILIYRCCCCSNFTRLRLKHLIQVFLAFDVVLFGLCSTNEQVDSTKRIGVLRNLPFNTFLVKSVKFDLVDFSRLIGNDTSSGISSSSKESMFAFSDDNDSRLLASIKPTSKALVSLRKSESSDKPGMLGKLNAEVFTSI